MSFNLRYITELKWHSNAWLYFTGDRQDGAAAGNGSVVEAVFLPRDFNGTTAAKHAQVDGSTWHTASFHPSWGVNIDRHNDNCSPVFYKMPLGIMSRMFKMFIFRQVFVIWAPGFDNASGCYRLWCSVLNCKINATLWPLRGTSMKTAYFAIFKIYVHRHMHAWHVFKMLLLWFDGNGYLCRDTKIGNG